MTSVNGTLERCFSYFSIDLVFMGLLMLCFVCWRYHNCLACWKLLFFSISRSRRASTEFSFSLEKFNRLFADWGVFGWCLLKILSPSVWITKRRRFWVKMCATGPNKLTHYRDYGRRYPNSSHRSRGMSFANQLKSKPIHSEFLLRYELFDNLLNTTVHVSLQFCPTKFSNFPITGSPMWVLDNSFAPLFVPKC